MGWNGRFIQAPPSVNDFAVALHRGQPVIDIAVAFGETGDGCRESPAAPSKVENKSMEEEN